MGPHCHWAKTHPGVRVPPVLSRPPHWGEGVRPWSHTRLSRIPSRVRGSGGSSFLSPVLYPAPWLKPGLTSLAQAGREISGREVGSWFRLAGVASDARARAHCRLPAGAGSASAPPLGRGAFSAKPEPAQGLRLPGPHPPAYPRGPSALVLRAMALRSGPRRGRRRAPDSGPRALKGRVSSRRGPAGSGRRRCRRIGPLA